MSKARTLADFISDGSEFADGTISVSEVSGAAPLASPSFTGNVGIGVTPATFYGRALHVHDTGTAGANIRLTDSNSGTTGNDGMDILQINNTSYIINREAGGMNFYTGGQLRYTIQGDGTHVFNENSLDSDFRVESDSNTHMLFVDAGNDFVGINKSSPEVVLHVRSTSAGAMTTFESSSANSSGGPNIRLWRNSASPADGDGLARLIFQGNNDAAERIDYAEIQTEIIDASDGTEDGLFQIETVVDGVSRNRLRLTGTESIFNDGQRNLDFRVESDFNANMIFMDAGSNVVAFGVTTSPYDSAGNEGFYYNYGGSLDIASNTNTLRINRNGTGGNNRTNIELQNNGTTRGYIGSFGAEGGIYLHNTSNIFMSGFTDEVVLNDESANLDFRVESDSNTHVLFVQGSGSGAVGINNNAPSYNLDVSGSTRTTQMVPSYSSITGTSSSANWWKLGTISNLAGSRSLKIRIQGTYSYSAGGQISGESTILFRGNNATTTIQGTFWSETEGLSHLSGVAWKNTGTGDQFDIWVNWASTFAGMDIFIESAAQWEYDISDTGSETVPSGATQISAIWNMFSGTSKTFSSYSTEAVINNDGSGGIDFRVESDANTHCFFVNAAENQVTMGNTSDALASRALFIKNNQYPQQNYATHASINYPTLQLRTAYATGGQTATQVDFRNGADGLVGTIKSTVNVTSYNTSSDQRLKENIVNAPSASDDIDAIQVRSFDWRANGLHQKYGMVAQELLTVAPDAVAQGDTEEDMMGVDYSKLVPMLIKEIQSLRARVAQLENA